jgi:two-component system, LytTR family, response regulator
MIVEDIEEVCKNIQDRMASFKQWQHIQSTGFLHIALQTIQEKLPDMLFLDWQLKGGSSYDILDFIKQSSNYNPYVIFFTGYASEEKNILIEIINKYKVNKFISKPIFENLTQNLKIYLEEAEEAEKSIQTIHEVLIKDFEGKLYKLNPKNIVCATISESNSRLKFVTMSNGAVIISKITLQEVEDIFKLHQITYQYPNKRDSIVAYDFIEKIEDNEVYLINKLGKIEISSTNINAFKKWFCEVIEYGKTIT